MSAKETSFTTLAGVPVHYDRLASPNGYGSKGKPREFFCRIKLRDALEACMTELFKKWKKGKPTIILTAGTIGDAENAHGQGYAFDLDGFWWGEKKFTMKDYPSDRPLYIGINAHLFFYFSQVLSYHYPNHKDHFHFDFNFAFRFRPESNAQTNFVQSALKYIYNKGLGSTGIEKDGVDGIYGSHTKQVVTEVLQELGLAGQGGLTKQVVWQEFLRITRERAFN